MSEQRPGNFEWGKLTWPELRDAARQSRVVLLPVGVIEDHGPHLPVDTDVLLAEGVARAGAELVPERVLLAPPIVHGYSPHHMDFPGTITVRGSVFIDYCIDVCKSIVHHGFERLLFVNGHGGNIPLIELAAKAVTYETGAFVASISHWALEPVKSLAAEILESPPAGGMVHADEYETSLYLALEPSRVSMDEAVREIEMPESRYFWVDLISGGDRVTSAGFMERWSTYTESGVIGDPTVASGEKGERLLHAAAQGIGELVEEIQARPIHTGKDHHDEPPRSPRVPAW